MTNVIFQAEYADFKLVKTRKTAQLVFEVPIEQVNDIINMIGMPNPAVPEWYAIARLSKEHSGPASQQAAAPEVVPTPPATSKSELSYVQRAGILANDEAFHKWAESSAPNMWKAALTEAGSKGKQEAAAIIIRKQCGVTSRRFIDRDQNAKDQFEKLWTTVIVESKYGGCVEPVS